MTLTHEPERADAPAETPAWQDAIAAGVHTLSFADYRELPGTNWHTLEPFRRSARHGRQAMLRPADASVVQVFGAAFHSAVLEPADFARDYVVRPHIDGHHNSNAYKAAKAEWDNAHADKVILGPEEKGILLAMQQAAKNHPLASAMLYGKGRNEMTCLWDDAETGRRCKGRVDRLARVKVGAINPLAPNANDDALCLIDLKTTRSVDYRDFAGDFARYAYHGQLAWYHDGVQALKPAPMSVFVIAIESTPPFDVVVYQVGEDELEHGRRLCRRLLSTLMHGEKTGEWPGTSDRAVPLYLPEWAKEGDL